jgi:hypothetical protein
MTSLTHTSFYHYTCKFCNVVRKAALIAFTAVIGFAESTGRARAARELAERGMYEEAKQLMMYRSEK